jgi:hypothetical protein
LVAANVKVAAGTIIGHAVADLGAYLYEAGSTWNLIPGRAYENVADTVDAVVTINAAGGANTKGRVKVIIHYCQLD